MTREEAIKYLHDYPCVCKYGMSPYACKDKENCEFSIAVRTICDSKGDDDWQSAMARDYGVRKNEDSNFELKACEVRSPIRHKQEIIRMLRKDTECPYSACVKAYEKALEYLRYGGDV